MSRSSSMTGFGEGSVEGKNFQLNVEIKSVNHRFRDIRVKLPSVLSSVEFQIKKSIEEAFKRGSFDVYINYKRSAENDEWELDGKKISSFLDSVEKATSKRNLKFDIKPTDFLRREFLVDQEDKMASELKELLTSALSQAIEKLKVSRRVEGSKLIKVIEEHFEIYKNHFKLVESESLTYKKSLEERLRKKMAEYSTEIKVDESRFLQEIVYYLEKLDVNEETNRIHSHLSKVQKLLSSSDEVGRELDFVLQEFGRETNTIGSKSGSTIISDAVIQMKVQLEKIREQSLNLE